MPELAHFAINADDVDRAKQFYTTVFGWNFTPWGPPGFFKIDGTGVIGALQGRRELIPGTRTNGFECTISVDSIVDTVKAVEAGGGKVLMHPSTIPTVGTLAFFQDPEGNVFGAMQFEKR
jgi:predicted enzyme related to lactoylglutathione lyase